MVAHMRNVAHKNAEEFASNVELIGPERAAEMLATMKYDKQRSISQAHVNYLADEMKAGRFVPGTAIRIAFVDGAPLLLDGQHRLSAVVASGEPQTFIVIEESAPDDQYVAWAYGNLDVGRRRTRADLYRAMELGERLGLSNQMINDLSPAVEFLVGGLRHPQPAARPNAAERVRLLELYAPYMRRLVGLVSGVDQIASRAMRRSYALSVALLSLRFSDPYAQARGGRSVDEFWRNAVLDDRLAADDPRKRLHRHLVTTVVSSGTVSLNGRTAVSAPYGARYVVGCFNAYMTNQPRKMIKVFDENAPASMYGVPREIGAWLR